MGKKDRMRSLLLFALATVAIIFLVSSIVPDNSPKCPKCNVLVVEFDVLNKRHMGTYGYFRNTTPSIDALARDKGSFIFSEAYSPTPFTCESDKSLFTGLKLSEAGICNLFYNRSKIKEVRVEGFSWLPEKFRKAGYRTGAVVSGNTLNETQLERAGFSFRYEGLHEDFARSVEVSKEWIASEKMNGEPFFLFVESYELHDPYFKEHYPEDAINYSLFGPVSDTGKYLAGPWTNSSITYAPGTGWQHTIFPYDWSVGERVNYTISAGDVSEVLSIYDSLLFRNDRLFGELVEFLKEKGIYENTVIVFTSEHGESLGEYGWFGHGTSLPDVSEIPLIIRVPGEKGGVLLGPASSLNLYSTLQEITGIGEEGLRLKSLFREADRKYAISELPEFDETSPEPSAYTVQIRTGGVLGLFFLKDRTFALKGFYNETLPNNLQQVPVPIDFEETRIFSEPKYSSEGGRENYWEARERELSERKRAENAQADILEEFAKVIAYEYPDSKGIVT